MHDVTSLLNLNKREVPAKIKVDFTNTFMTEILEEPYKLLIKLKRHIKTHKRPDIPKATEKALLKLASSLVKLSISLN